MTTTTIEWSLEDSHGSFKADLTPTRDADAQAAQALALWTADGIATGELDAEAEAEEPESWELGDLITFPSRVVASFEPYRGGTLHLTWAPPEA